MLIDKQRFAFLCYVLAVHILCLALILQPELSKQIGLNLSLYQPKRSEFYYRSIIPQQRHEKQLPGGAVVLFGDSIIQSWWRESYSWPVANYGIGGDTSKGVLDRLSQYDRLSEASVIVIGVGVNDLNRRTVDEVAVFYQQIIAALPKQAALLFLTVLPVSEAYPEYEGYNDRINRLNDLLLALTEACNNCSLVDAGANLVDQTGNLATEYHSGDGLHLSAKGYEVWGRQVVEGIDRALPSS